MHNDDLLEFLSIGNLALPFDFEDTPRPLTHI